MSELRLLIAADASWQQVLSHPAHNGLLLLDSTDGLTYSVTVTIVVASRGMRLHRPVQQFALGGQRRIEEAERKHTVASARQSDKTEKYTVAVV